MCFCDPFLGFRMLRIIGKSTSRHLYWFGGLVQSNFKAVGCGIQEIYDGGVK